MQDSKKIEIAKDFISRHKNDNIAEWQISGVDHKRLLDLYTNLVNSVYGHLELVESKNNIETYSIEIHKSETKSGRTDIFEFDNEA